jgi:hypothetical protein
MWIEDTLVACIMLLSRSAASICIASLPTSIQSIAGMALKPAAELTALCGSTALRGMFAPLHTALCAANLALNVAQIWLPKPLSRHNWLP